MKKAIFLFAFTFVLGAFAANAQSCCSKAGANKAACGEKISKAAAADPSIEKRQSDDGSVAYVRKEADAQGNVKFASVQFDEASNAFVNVAPKVLVADKTEMTKKTTQCTTSEKKACAGGAGQGKACCANKAASSCTEKKAEQ
jgi:hypothetical protein